MNLKHIWFRLSSVVPFREAPAYSKRRRGPSSGNGNDQSPSSLSAPRVLLRSNSDNNLTVSQYQQYGSPSNWAPGLQQHQHTQAYLHRVPQQVHPQPGSSEVHRSLSPQLLQQMPSGNPNGNVVVRTMGRGARSRSPSLSRLGEEARRAQRQPKWVFILFKIFTWSRIKILELRSGTVTLLPSTCDRLVPAWLMSGRHLKSRAKQVRGKFPGCDEPLPVVNLNVFYKFSFLSSRRTVVHRFEGEWFNSQSCTSHTEVSLSKILIFK